MTRLEGLADELTTEADKTRKHIARLTDDHLDWRPHPKSFDVRGLTSHLVDCIRWTEWIFGAPELSLDVGSYKPFVASNVAGFLEEFDRTLTAGQQAMASCEDTEAQELWTLRLNGSVQFQRAREAAFRDMTLHHLIHHRGQLSLYLRLLDLPVPGSYGPTADDAR